MLSVTPSAVPRGRAVRGPAAARRGSVIVVVLVTLLLASLMLVKFMESSAVELTLATRQADQNRLRADAYAAVETVLAVMAEIQAVDEGLYAPEQGWGDPYAYAGEAPREGVTVTYEFIDESGKASLPGLPFEEMVELAQVLGLGETDARRFADGLYTWMRADHMPQEIEAEASRYERDDPPIKVPKRSLRSWEELRAVKVAREYVYDADGALTPFGAALRQNISLYAFEGTNVNALAPALGTARGWDETQAGQVAGYRSGRAARAAGAPKWFRGVEDVRSVIGANADTEGLDATIKLLRVNVTVRAGVSSMVLTTLVALADGVELPAVAVPEDGSGTPAAVGAGTPAPADAAAAAAGTTAGLNGGVRPTTGRTGRTGAGGAGGRSGGEQTEEKLDYPFGILEVNETSGPPPPVIVEEEEPPL